jgi:hypothetical protein
MAKEVVGKVTLLNVRLSFAALFEPDKRKQDDGTIRETWKSNFLFPKGGGDVMAMFHGKKVPIMEALKKAGDEAREKKWGDKKNWPKLKPDRVAVRDGDLEDWDGYEGMTYLSANAPLADRPQVVTNRKNKDGWIEAEPGGKGSPYSGCYVNAVVELWCQDNEHGKRLNAKLKAVQFVADGEPFGAAPVDVNDEFTEDMIGDQADIGGDFDGDDGGEEDDDDSMI